MNSGPEPVLDYATPTPPQARLPFFVSGFLLAELLSVLLLALILAGGPLFPFTVLFAPLAVLVESTGSDRVLGLSLFVGGPLLYGLYATLLALPNRMRNVGVAAGAHAACFAVTLWQRAVFSVL